MFERLRQINKLVRQERLSWPLIITGGVLFATGFFALWLGTVGLVIFGGSTVRWSGDPAFVEYMTNSTIVGLLTDGRFYLVLIAFGGICLLTGMRLHPAILLQRKLGHEAIQTMKQSGEWPWD